MNVTAQQNPDGVMVLRATVSEADYAPEVDKNLKELRRKANIPGFRPGMVPMGIINKMYRKGALAEQSYRKANEAVFKHLEDNKIEIMGDVMPSDEQGELDFDGEGTDYEFVFEAGVAPAVELELGDKDNLARYTIKPSKEMREGYRSRFLARYSRPETPEQSADETAENALAENEADTQGHADTDSRADTEKPVKFIEPTLDEEFFAMVFPDGKVTDVAGFDKFLDEAIAADLARESDFMFSLQLKNHLLEKAGLKLPEEFLKKWLYAVNEGKFSMDEIERDFPAFLRLMAWGLVQKHFEDKLGLEVTHDDLLEEAKAMARMQFAQYGMQNVPDETLEGFAKSILASKEEAQRIYERVREDKVLTALKPLVSTTDKKVTSDEFQKIASEM